MEDLDRKSNVLPERVEKEKVSDYLKRLESLGFLFHGTRVETEGLEPRKANDPNSEWNSQEAVYASAVPEWSAIFAVAGDVRPWKTKVRRSGVYATIEDRFREQVEKGRGRIYVLSPDGFESDPDGGPQRVSKKHVVPLGFVEVGYDDYLEMGGKVDWVEKVKIN